VTKRSSLESGKSDTNCVWKDTIWIPDSPVFGGILYCIYLALQIYTNIFQSSQECSASQTNTRCFSNKTCPESVHQRASFCPSIMGPACLSFPTCHGLNQPLQSCHAACSPSPNFCPSSTALFISGEKKLSIQWGWGYHTSKYQKHLKIWQIDVRNLNT
jgi:hypothetical protein